MSYTEHEDPWLALCERFAARGATLRIGNAQQDMIRHLLDSLEELEATVKGVEDRLRRLRDSLEELGAAVKGVEDRLRRLREGGQ